MQVTETLSDGLKREFRVVVPANDLDSKVNTRLGELKDTVRINGFRPGKVPVGHLKRLYGRSVMAETIEAAVRDANAKIVSDNNLRLAMEPQVKLPTEEEAIKAVVEGKADLDYSVAMEVLPKIELADFKDIKLERLIAEVTDAEVDEAIGRIAEQNRPFLPKPEGAVVVRPPLAAATREERQVASPTESTTTSTPLLPVASRTFRPTSTPR